MEDVFKCEVCNKEWILPEDASRPIKYHVFTTEFLYALNVHATECKGEPKMRVSGANML